MPCKLPFSTKSDEKKAPAKTSYELMVEKVDQMLSDKKCNGFPVIKGSAQFGGGCDGDTFLSVNFKVENVGEVRVFHNTFQILPEGRGFEFNPTLAPSFNHNGSPSYMTNYFKANRVVLKKVASDVSKLIRQDGFKEALKYVAPNPATLG